MIFKMKKKKYFPFQVKQENNCKTIKNHMKMIRKECLWTDEWGIKKHAKNNFIQLILSFILSR